MDFFPQVHISDVQAEAIARGMFAVARADGELHPREAALVSDFYADSVEGHAPDMAALEREADISPQSLALALGSPDHRRLFLKTAILLAYADGEYSAPESKKILEFATALEMQKELPRLEEQVKDYLLSHLTGLANTEGVMRVAKELEKQGG